MSTQTESKKKSLWRKRPKKRTNGIVDVAIKGIELAETFDNLRYEAEMKLYNAKKAARALIMDYRARGDGKLEAKFVDDLAAALWEEQKHDDQGQGDSTS